MVHYVVGTFVAVTVIHILLYVCMLQEYEGADTRAS